MTVAHESITAYLAARLDRLEAAESLRAAHNDYFYLIDAGRVDELLDLYTENVAWSATNVPFGSGQTLRCQGRSQVRPVLEALGHGTFRHHGVNVDIRVSDDAATATSAAYMLVVSRSRQAADALTLLGGLYEGTWEREVDRWRISSWRVSNQWMADGVGEAKFFDGLREGSQWDGRPRRVAP